MGLDGLREFEAVCRQLLWKRRRTNDLLRICDAAVLCAQRALCSPAHSLGWVLLPAEDMPQRSRERAVMRHALSRALVTDAAPGRCASRSLVRQGRVRREAAPRSGTMLKDDFLEYVRTSHAARVRVLRGSVGVSSPRGRVRRWLRARRLRLKDALHLVVPSAASTCGAVDAARLFPGALRGPIDVIAPSSVRSDRLQYWQQSGWPQLRVATPTDVARKRCPVRPHACSRLWTVAQLMRADNPRLTFYDIVVVDDVEGWPAAAIRRLQTLSVRVCVVVGFDSGVAQLRSALSYLRSSERPVLWMHPRCGGITRGCERLTVVATCSLQAKAPSAFARAVSIWVARLAESLLGACMNARSSLAQARTAARAFEQACAFGEGCAVVRTIAHWTKRAVAVELAAKWCREAGAEALSLVLGESARHLCVHCLGIWRAESHTCDWSMNEPVLLPEVEDAGAHLVGYFFRMGGFSLHVASRVRQCVRAAQQLRLEASVVTRCPRQGRLLLHSWAAAIAVAEPTLRSLDDLAHALPLTTGYPGSTVILQGLGEFRALRAQRAAKEEWTPLYTLPLASPGREGLEEKLEPLPVDALRDISAFAMLHRHLLREPHRQASKAMLQSGSNPPSPVLAGPCLSAPARPVALCAFRPLCTLLVALGSPGWLPTSAAGQCPLSPSMELPRASLSRTRASVFLPLDHGKNRQDARALLGARHACRVHSPDRVAGLDRPGAPAPTLGVYVTVERGTLTGMGQKIMEKYVHALLTQCGPSSCNLLRRFERGVQDRPWPSRRELLRSDQRTHVTAQRRGRTQHPVCVASQIRPGRARDGQVPGSRPCQLRYEGPVR